MTLPALLRLVGALLAVTATGSALAGLVSAVGTWQASSGPDASLGLLMLFLGGAVQSFWQALAGVALALLCFAAARLLDTARQRPLYPYSGSGVSAEHPRRIT